MKLTRYDEHILQYDDVCTDDDSNNIIEWCHKHRYRGYDGDENIASMEKTSIRHNKSYDITKTLTAEDYFYDLEITNTSTEQRWRLIEGKIKIKKQVTSANPQD